MPYIALDVPAELHEVLARRAGERGERLEAFALACLTAGLHLPSMEGGDEACCSFCGKGRDQVRRLVTARAARICAECVEECRRLLDQGQAGAAGEPAP